MPSTRSSKLCLSDPVLTYRSDSVLSEIKYRILLVVPRFPIKLIPFLDASPQAL